MKITIDIPQDVVESITHTQRGYLAGTEEEYAAQHVVMEWLESQIDTAFDITSEVLSALNIKEDRDE